MYNMIVITLMRYYFLGGGGGHKTRNYWAKFVAMHAYSIVIVLYQEEMNKAAYELALKDLNLLL